MIYQKKIGIVHKNRSKDVDKLKGYLQQRDLQSPTDGVVVGNHQCMLFAYETNSIQLSIFNMHKDVIDLGRNGMKGALVLDIDCLCKNDNCRNELCFVSAHLSVSKFGFNFCYDNVRRHDLSVVLKKFFRIALRWLQ